MKSVIFHGEAKRALKAMPKVVRQRVGDLLLDLQYGASLGLPHARPMSTVALGAWELRVSDPAGTYRIFYYMKVKDYLLVFHAFQKKTRETPLHEMRTGLKRLKELLNAYEKEGQD